MKLTIETIESKSDGKLMNESSIMIRGIIEELKDYKEKEDETILKRLVLEIKTKS